MSKHEISAIISIEVALAVMELSIISASAVSSVYPTSRMLSKNDDAGGISFTDFIL